MLGMLDALHAGNRNVPTVAELRNNILDAQDNGVPQHRERVIIDIPPAGKQRIPLPTPTAARKVLGDVIGPGFVDPDPRAISLSETEAVCCFRQDNPWTAKYVLKLRKISCLLRIQDFAKVCSTVIAHVGNRGSGRVSLIHPREARLLSLGERMAAQCLPLDRGPIPADLVTAHHLVGDSIPPPLMAAVGREILRYLTAEAGQGEQVTKLPRAADGVLVVPCSGNAKTGPVAATYVSQATCPNSCPFKNNGCYGERDNCVPIARRLNASGITSATSIAREEAHQIDLLADPVDLRVHVLGDCMDESAASIIGTAMARYEQRTGRGAWTYTHSWREIDIGAWQGANVLASCETLEEARAAHARDYAAAMVVPSHDSEKASVCGGGLRLVPCPSQTRGRTCVECRLCMRASKLKEAKIIITLAAHGSGRRLVREMLADKNIAAPTTPESPSNEMPVAAEVKDQTKHAHAIKIIDEKAMLDLLSKSKRVLLVEPRHGKYMPLGLAKIATFIKNNGCKVEFGDTPRGHDLIVITTIFTYDSALYRKAIRDIRKLTNAPILIGGICASLAPHLLESDGHGELYLFQGFSPVLDQCVPDYSIDWGERGGWEKFSFVFTTRGCVNHCGYCAVPRLEKVSGGGIWVVPNWKEHIVPSRPCVLLDNNITASPTPHLKDVVDALGRTKTLWDNGIDCKHVDHEKAELLGKLNWERAGLRIAFDRIEEDGVFQSAVRMLIEHGVNPWKIMGYVLFNFNDTPQEAEYRLLECARLGIELYPLQYVPINKDSRDNPFIGKHWSKPLCETFRHYGIMGKYRFTGNRKKFVS